MTAPPSAAGAVPGRDSAGVGGLQGPPAVPCARHPCDPGERNRGASPSGRRRV